ncbi:hypothetical protein RB213_009030 [Colletotrichum asianum]
MIPNRLTDQSLSHGGLWSPVGSRLQMQMRLANNALKRSRKRCLRHDLFALLSHDHLPTFITECSMLRPDLSHRLRSNWAGSCRRHPGTVNIRFPYQLGSYHRRELPRRK